MPSRAEQREETRAKIIKAAINCFALKGFSGASTRDIANDAGVNQGLLTYHFQNKETLWRAATDTLFADMQRDMESQLVGIDDPRNFARQAVRTYVLNVAARPELFHFMLDQGGQSEERIEWMVEKHLRPAFDYFSSSLVSAKPSYHMRFIR